MTPERIANMLGDNDVLTSAQQDALEFCWHCSEPIIGGEIALEDGELFHANCLECYHEKQYSHIREAL